MKTIEGDLILKEDTSLNEGIHVKGNIIGYFNLKVDGNINCRNIDCGNIDCRDINCWDIDCLNIDCWNIDCLNINCRNIDCGNINCWNIDCLNINCWNIILCDKFKARGKVRAKALFKNRFNLPQKSFDKIGEFEK